MMQVKHKMSEIFLFKGLKVVIMNASRQFGKLWLRNEDRLRDDRLKDKTQDQIMLPIGYTGSVWNWTPQTELTMAETSRLEGPVCELQHHWRGRGWGITSARRTSELIVDKKDCSRCAAEEEEGGIVSAPPLLPNKFWAHHIDSIYNDSRQLEWLGAKRCRLVSRCQGGFGWWVMPDWVHQHFRFLLCPNPQISERIPTLKYEGGPSYSNIREDATSACPTTISSSPDTDSPSLSHPTNSPKK